MFSPRSLLEIRDPVALAHLLPSLDRKPHSIGDQPLDPPTPRHPHVLSIVYRPGHDPLARGLAVPQELLPVPTRQHGHGDAESIEVPKVFPSEVGRETDVKLGERGEVPVGRGDEEGVPETEDETGAELGLVRGVRADDVVHEGEDLVRDGKDLDIDL